MLNKHEGMSRIKQILMNIWKELNQRLIISVLTRNKQRTMTGQSINRYYIRSVVTGKERAPDQWYPSIRKRQ